MAPEQALAFVRSRKYQEVIDGVPQGTSGSDLERIVRQQQFLREVLKEAGSSRNPLHLARIGNALVDGLSIDNHMELFDALVFAWNMGQLDPVQTELPVMGSGDGATVVLAPGAEDVIADFSTSAITSPSSRRATWGGVVANQRERKNPRTLLPPKTIASAGTGMPSMAGSVCRCVDNAP